MPTDIVKINGKEYAIVYAIINGDIIIFDVGEVHYAPGESYIIPTTPGEVRLALSEWRRRLVGLRDGLKPAPRHCRG
ncbi:hypothetical protein [Vulcanisaeta souniana]|uniref:Uncharacterized protein n=1 Tax=Vulcanisaeta souniana JCM 11219 TaxID=1293586 RepID=A0A830E639_9CREN|nr:hypothetical protein [Vulcanisaeta souniana]BDR92246.1 hypothetical protein Vsou_13390 [Vulcanisaeta souniana JCM 11219]GGI86151.1 hypothetical protein GCM10007112_23960 [Vulcanisaeta souniana JCM 11219]